MCKYGYIRVSSKEQNADRQIIALIEAGVNKEHLYMDKQSGKDFNRKQYKRMVRKLKPKDVLIVKSIDRLGYATARHSPNPRFNRNIDC